MLRLLVKESRQLLPIGCLWLSVLVLNYIVQFSTERIDELTFGGWCEGYCDYDTSAFVIVFSVLIALVTAYSLFPREHDDATIDFLRALPVSPRAVFIAKVFAGWGLLVLINLLSYGLDALLLAVNPESIGGRFYPQVWGTLLWRDCLLAFIILSHGILLSWFRTIGLVVYAIYLLLLMWAESALGTSGIWSIFALHSNEYDGSSLLVNTQALAVHTAVAIGILLLAYLLWSRTESSVAGGKTPGRSMRVFRGLLTVFGFIALALALVYRVDVGTGSSAQDDLRVAATEHYRFVYPAEKESTVQYILEYAEEDYAALAQLLGVTDLPRIRVDLSADSEHAAGLATWKKIKMDLNAFDTDLSQRRVLSHETTHVLQAVESDRAMSRNYAAVKFFIEGMAQYTSFEVVEEKERRDSNWQLAAVSWKRQGIEFSDLIDEAGFSARFDPELHYSLGDLWTKAFVSVCGEEALGDFLRASGREGAMSGLLPAIFWRDTARSINCDLDTVNERWHEQMEDTYASVNAALFPSFSEVLTTRDDASGQIVITAKLRDYSPRQGRSASDLSASDNLDASATKFVVPDRFIVRVSAGGNRLAASVDPVYRGQLIDSNTGAPAVRFVIPSSAVSGSRFRFQLGFAPSINSRYYYEEWKRGSL